jgi:hypothetical protein
MTLAHSSQLAKSMTWLWNRDNLVESKLNKITKLNSQINIMLKGDFFLNKTQVFKEKKRKKIQVNSSWLVKPAISHPEIWEHDNPTEKKRKIYSWSPIHNQSNIERWIWNKINLKIDITNEQSQHGLIFETCVPGHGARITQ